jgi:hypothetical protein
MTAKETASNAEISSLLAERLKEQKALDLVFGDLIRGAKTMHHNEIPANLSSRYNIEDFGEQESTTTTTTTTPAKEKDENYVLTDLGRQVVDAWIKKQDAEYDEKWVAEFEKFKMLAKAPNGFEELMEKERQRFREREEDAFWNMSMTDPAGAAEAFTATTTTTTTVDESKFPPLTPEEARIKAEDVRLGVDIPDDYYRGIMDRVRFNLPQSYQDHSAETKTTATNSDSDYDDLPELVPITEEDKIALAKTNRIRESLPNLEDDGVPELVPMAEDDKANEIREVLPWADRQLGIVWNKWAFPPHLLDKVDTATTATTTITTTTGQGETKVDAPPPAVRYGVAVMYDHTKSLAENVKMREKAEEEFKQIRANEGSMNFADLPLPHRLPLDDFIIKYETAVENLYKDHGFKLPINGWWCGNCDVNFYGPTTQCAHEWIPISWPHLDEVD